MRLFFWLVYINLLHARPNRDTEEKLKKLPESTKRMIQALAATGHPKEAIADRIKFDVGKG